MFAETSPTQNEEPHDRCHLSLRARYRTRTLDGARRTWICHRRCAPPPAARGVCCVRSRACDLLAERLLLARLCAVLSGSRHCDACLSRRTAGRRVRLQCRTHLHLAACARAFGLIWRRALRRSRRPYLDRPHRLGPCAWLRPEISDRVRRHPPQRRWPTLTPTLRDKHHAYSRHHNRSRSRQAGTDRGSRPRTMAAAAAAAVAGMGRLVAG